MKKYNFEKIKWNIFVTVPFILGVLLLWFFIYSDLYLWNHLLTNEWLYIVLWLFIFSLVPGLVIKIISEKLQEDEISEHIKKCIWEEIKNNPKIKEMNKNIWYINDEVWIWSQNIKNKNEIQHKDKNLVEIIFNYANEKKLEIFKRNNSWDFWIKLKYQILLCWRTSISLKINKSDIKEEILFKEYLLENNLAFFKDILKIDEYWRDTKTALDYKWVKLQLSDINFKEKINEFIKLLDLIVKNNER